MSTINHINTIQKDATTFLDHALALRHVMNSNNVMDKLAVLDSTLKLWVEIETTMQGSKNALPQQTKENLSRLSNFVTGFIMTKGVDMSAQNFETLINVNMQISEGLFEAAKNLRMKEDAFSLVKCAVDIAKAKDNNDDKALVNALDNNLKLWVQIKTLAQREQSALPNELKSNLVKLSDYVSSQTIRIGQDIQSDNIVALDSLISTNLQISEGLVGKKAS